MRNTAEAGHPAVAAEGAGTRRRGRGAAKTEPASSDAAPAESPQNAQPEPPAVAVTTVRMVRVNEGLYALRVGPLTGTPAEIAGMAVPVAHVSAPFAEDGNGVEIVASFPGRGPWLARDGGTLILRSPPPAGGHVIVTAYGAPDQQQTGELSLDLHRLDGPGRSADAPGMLEPITPGPRAAGLTGMRDLPTEILLHIERAGDRVFPGRGWVGALGRRMRIEGFSIRPLERLAPSDIEMKGFLPSGGETPWVQGGALCGTRGRGLPLVGFALRIVPQWAERFDVFYQGSFFSGGISEQHSGGSPCRAAADDPLEAVNIRVVERVAASEVEPAIEADPEEDASAEPAC
jgi:hypothetical protein